MSGRCEWLIRIPCTTELISSLDTKAEAAGITPAIAVVAKRPTVMPGLASQTRRRTWGSAAVVPVTACLRFSQRPRRSLGPSGSGGGSRVGSPVRPLLAGPESALRRRPNHHIPEPCCGGLIPILGRASETLVDSHRVAV